MNAINAAHIGTDEGLNSKPYLSIILKARNEEEKIASALDAAEEAARRLAPRSVEIVLADSCSTDNTVALAGGRPVRVVQFVNEADCGCGAGVELGYQSAHGEFVYVLDADMCLDPDFLPAALELMRKDPSLGGVGGLVVDTRVHNAVDRIRVNNKAATSTGEAPWLLCGGLYRRAAIESAGGYAAHPDLKAYEEAELGMRLRSAGWKLVRLNQTAVLHTGHSVGGVELMMRHWRSRRAMAAGVFLRSAWGQPWFGEVVWHCRHMLLVPVWWLSLPLTMVIFGWPALGWWIVCSLIAVALYIFRKRDPQHALFGIFGWHFQFAGLIGGLTQPLGVRRRVLLQRTLQDWVPLAGPLLSDS